MVQAYIDTNDYREADRIQRNLYQDYLNDIARYAEPAEKVKAENAIELFLCSYQKKTISFSTAKLRKAEVQESTRPVSIGCLELIW